MKVEEIGCRLSETLPHGQARLVNQSLTPHAPRDPVLIARRRQEARYLKKVSSLSSRFYFVPWLKQPLDLAGAEAK